MDLTPFKQDIDELLNDFAQEGLTGFADMKMLWLSRKFSYIFEGRPKTNSAVFMQGLYAHCLGHIISSGSLSQKLGGLYCLYCLHETQPYKPLFKIYLSLGELKQIKDLVRDAKKNAIGVVPSLVKRMLTNNTFLFGFVDIFGTSVAQRIDEITKLQDRRVQTAYEKLFADKKIEDYLHMNLGAEIELAELKKMSSEYAKAKHQAITGVSSSIDVEDVKHIAERKDQIGDRMQEIVDAWDHRKQGLYKQTGPILHNEIVALDTIAADDSEVAYTVKCGFLVCNLPADQWIKLVSYHASLKSLKNPRKTKDGKATFELRSVFWLKWSLTPLKIFPQEPFSAHMVGAFQGIFYAVVSGIGDPIILVVCKS